MSFWNVYKSKVLQTFNADQEEEHKEEGDSAEMIEKETPEEEDEGLNMSQLARKVQGTFGWRTVTSLFSKEEQKSDQGEEQSPAQHPTENPHEKRSSALWDVFANKWQQRSHERSEGRGVLAEPPEESNEVQQPEETPFSYNIQDTKKTPARFLRPKELFEFVFNPFVFV